MNTPFTRRSVLGSGLLAAGSTLLGRRAQATGRPPNIVYMYLDQVRWDMLGFRGYPVLTPAIDQLALQGVHFPVNTTVSPICMPARASMMTNLYPFEHGVQWNAGEADKDGPSHVRRMRDAGWHTAMIGKAHMHSRNGDMRDYAHVLEDWGFVTTVETGGPVWAADNPSEYTDWLTATTPPGQPDYYGRLQRYNDDYSIHAKRYAEWLTRAPDIAPWYFPPECNLDTWIGQRAARFISDYADPEPFYLQVNLGGPHPPWDAGMPFRSLYDPRDPRLPRPDLTPVRPYSRPIAIAQDELVGPSNNSEAMRCVALYLAKMTMNDDALGAVIDALHATGRLEDTWVILHGDHGEMLGDHGLLSKLVFFESSVRVPLVIRPPGGVTPWTSEALTDQFDVTKTILDIAGIAEEDDRGRALTQQVLDGPDAPGAQVGKPFVMGEIALTTMIRTTEFKLIYDSETEEEQELYDLRVDPNENVNLVRDPAYADVRATLHAYGDAERSS